MKRISVRLIVLALTFTTGFTTVALWRNAGTLFFSKIAQPFAATKPLPSPQSSNRPKRNGIEEEEYAVVSALINHYGRKEEAAHLLVIRDQPSPWSGFSDDEKDKFYEDLKKSSPALMPETVDDLQAKNKEEYTFTRRFDIKRRYVFISEEEINTIFDKRGFGWDKFYQKYPGSGGFLTFSRVGFNADKTQALVYQSYSCGDLCGGGTYYLLTKENGIWTVKGSVGPAWVS